MIALVLGGFAARRLRAALTALAVVFGVAMITGTYVQTDQIKQAFTDIEQASNVGRDVVISRKPPLESGFAEPAPLDDSILSKLRRIPGVAQADGQLWTMGRLREGNEEFSSGFAPSMVVSTVPAPYNPFKVVKGHAPTRRTEVMVNRELAESRHLRLGGSYELETRTGLKPVTLSGWFELHNGASFGGATSVATALGNVQEWFDLEGKITTAFVAADKGNTADELAARIAQALPEQYEVRTGTDQAATDAKKIGDAIGGFLTPMMLAFGAAAVLVGAFIIFNTFSITVAQRTREFALLRALGCSRRQVMVLVAGEALLIGLIASAAGLAAGLGFAVLLGWLFETLGMGIPRSGLILQDRTIIAAFAVGIGVTLVAAVSPALRATRIPPIMAMQGEVPVRRGRLRNVLAALVALGGLGMLSAGLFAGGAATARMSMMGGGAVLMFVGIALNARHVVRPIAGLVGMPLERIFHSTGRLARENAMRNPGRTATTSAALMVGLGLVIFVAVLASGIKSSLSSTIDERVTAPIMVAGSATAPIPGGVSDIVPAVKGVRAVTPLHVDQLKVGDEPIDIMVDVLSGVDAATLAGTYDVDWIEGDDALLSKLKGDRILIEEQFAKQHGVGVGDRIRVASSRARGSLVVIGEYRDPQLVQGTIVDLSTFRNLSAAADPWVLFTALEEGASAEQVKADLTQALKPFPAAKAQTIAEYKADSEEQINQMIYLLYALLAMSVVISLFGIANSLFLSIHERTREFGLLRAIGTTGRQVRRIVRYESVITAVIGGLLGLAVGVLLAWLMTMALTDLGLTFHVPYGQLAGFLLLAILVGVAGAVFPARRGSRIDVLEALHHE